MTKLSCALLLSTIVGLAACEHFPDPWPHGSGGSIWGTGGSVWGSGGAWGTGGKTWGSGGSIWGSGGAWGTGGSPIQCRVGGIPPMGVKPIPGCDGAFGNDQYVGYFFTMSDRQDGGGSTICPDCTDVGCIPAIGQTMCAAGVAAKVVGTQYSTYWGAGVGWNLNQPVSAPTCSAIPGVADLTGKTLNVALDSAPASFRVMLDLDDPTTILCRDVSGQGKFSLKIEEFVQECWAGGSRVPITPAQMAAVKGIRFMIPTNTSVDVPFSFCILNLSID